VSARAGGRARAAPPGRAARRGRVRNCAACRGWVWSYFARLAAGGFGLTLRGLPRVGLALLCAACRGWVWSYFARLAAGGFGLPLRGLPRVGLALLWGGVVGLGLVLLLARLAAGGSGFVDFLARFGGTCGDSAFCFACALFCLPVLTCRISAGGSFGGFFGPGFCPLLGLFLLDIWGSSRDLLGRAWV